MCRKAVRHSDLFSYSCTTVHAPRPDDSQGAPKAPSENRRRYWSRHYTDSSRASACHVRRLSLRRVCARTAPIGERRHLAPGVAHAGEQRGDDGAVA